MELNRVQISRAGGKDAINHIPRQCKTDCYLNPVVKSQTKLHRFLRSMNIMLLALNPA